LSEGRKRLFWIRGEGLRKSGAAILIGNRGTGVGRDVRSERSKKRGRTGHFFVMDLWNATDWGKDA